MHKYLLKFNKRYVSISVLSSLLLILSSCKFQIYCPSVMKLITDHIILDGKSGKDKNEYTETDTIT